MSAGTRPATMPIISLAEFRADGGRRSASAVDEACRSSGFFLVVEHGVAPGITAELLARSREFFARQQSYKDLARTTTNGLLGYRGLNTLHASSKTKPSDPFDAKEIFTIGREGTDPALAGAYPEFFPPNVWPPGMAAFRHALLTYFDAMAALSSELADLLAVALGLAAGRLSGGSGDQTSWLTTINYPQAGPAPLAPDQLRFGSHRDRDCFTILSTTAPGLEVLPEGGEWTPVPVGPDAFIINIGSMLANWTGGRWVAPLHRVGRPDVGHGETASRRQSLVYFYSPSPSVSLAPLPVVGSPGSGALNGPTYTVADHLRSLLGIYR